ncbi:DUF2202 domain-containing protein [Streptomyces sp. NPDC057616]|uniref:DUF2202 domain-containing protein n=1 Tax=Streptomyces sp. NPDC057616 TaxID=3346183 RepID=UPI00367EC268
MKRNIRIATAVGAAALTVGGLLTVGAVAAGGDTGPAPWPTTRQHMMTDRQDDGERQGERLGGRLGDRYGQRHGDGMHDSRHGGGCTGYTALAPRGTLTTAQKSTLARMAEEEKLARDLYTGFADRYGVPLFERTTAAENSHLAAVRTLLDRYDVTDPTAGKATGDFADPAVRATYDRYLKQGDGSLTAALNTGHKVEADETTALRHALTGLKAPDVRQIYGNLLAASERHEEAFEHASSDR